MLRSWSQTTVLKTYGQTIPDGNTRQPLRVDIQKFLLSNWMRSLGGLIRKMIQWRRSLLSWNLLRIRNNFGVSGCVEQPRDGLDSSLHRTSMTMILTQEVLDRYRVNQGYVYLIHAEGTDRYKIGRSVNPVVRLEQLKGQSPYPLRIIECFWSPDAIADEIGIHKMFAEYRAHGEWFEFTKSHPDKSQYLEFIKDTFDYNRPVLAKIIDSSWDYFLQSIPVDDTNLLEVISENRRHWDEVSKRMGPVASLSGSDISELFGSMQQDGLTKFHDRTSSLTFLYHRANDIETLKKIDYFTRECLTPAVYRYGQITKNNIPYQCLLCVEAAIESFEKFLFGNKRGIA